MDSVPTLAKALAERTSRKPRKAGKATKCRRPRRESTKTITTRLYRMWSDVVKHLFDNRCAVCGEPDSKEHPLNAHHIMPRQNFSGLRFHPKNGVALCPRCHKLGKYSAHKGGIWFAEWLRTHDREVYEFCLSRHADELDCKDRMVLYGWEYSLVNSSAGIDCGFYLGIFKVEAVRRDGEPVSSSVQAYNAKAAETIFWENWPESEPPLKGIVSCKLCKPCKEGRAARLPDETARELKDDLVRRGLMDEDGNQILRQTTPRCCDTAKIAMVQEALKK